MLRHSKLSRLYLLAPLTTLAMIVSSAAARADSLAGKVLDPQGLPVADAKVALFDRNSGERRNTVTARDGTYDFADIPAGAYLIEAEAGSSALIVSREVPVSGDQTLDLTLRVAGARTSVSVTASSTSQTLTEVAKALDTVTAEQIDQRDVFQIAEAIRVLPGVQVQMLGGPGSFTSIRTRGLRNFDTAILVDGIRFQDSASLQNDATSFLDSLTTTDTERVEFMRGSGASLYGSSAMAGVINIVSRSGGGPIHGELRAEGGGLGLFRGVGGIGGGSDRVDYSGSVSHVNVARGVRGRIPYRNSSGQGSVRYDITPAIALTGRVWGAAATATSTESPAFTPAILANSPPTGQVRAIPLPTDQLERFEQGLPVVAGNATYIPSQIDPDGTRKSSFVSATAALQHVISANTTYRVAYHGIDTRRGYADGPAGPGRFEPFSAGTDHLNGRTDTLQARLDQRIGSHSFVTAGYELAREQYVNFSDTPTDSSETDAIRLSVVSHSLYAQDQIPLLSGRLQLSVSGRVQLFSLQQPVFGGIVSNPYDDAIKTIETPGAFTADGSVAYFFERSQTKLRAHGGNSYRAPSAYERFGGGFGSYYGDPRLEPERAIAIDVGVDQWLFRSKLQLSGTLFVTKLEQVISFANTLPPDDPFTRPFGGYVNSSGGRARGFELSAYLSPAARTTAQLSYSYTDSRSNIPTIAGTDYFKAVGLSPHVFSLTATQWIGPRLHTTFDLFTRSHYVISMSGGGSRRFEFEGATRANLVVGYQLATAGAKRLELYAKIENLFDHSAYENGFVAPGRWAVTGLRFKY
jgi:vitamin B12 transporter